MLMEECNYKPADLMCVQEISGKSIQILPVKAHQEKWDLEKKKYIYSPHYEK